MKWKWARWVLAAGILLFSGWRLAEAWSSLEHVDLVFRIGPAVGSALTGAGALLALALVSAAGARAANLPSPPRAGFWLGWMRVWFQGYFYRYIPGKLVLVVERARLGELLGVPRAASVMLVVWESLLLLSGAGVLGSIGLLSMPPREGQPVSGAAVAVLATASLAGSIVLWPALGAVAARFPRVRARLPGIVLTVSPLAQVALVAGNALAWLLLGASFALCCQALSPGSTPDATRLATWFVASYVGGQVASVVPAGLGIREALLVAGLADVVSAPVALAWAVAHRIVLLVVELVMVGLSLLIRLPPTVPAAPSSSLPEIR